MGADKNGLTYFYFIDPVLCPRGMDICLLHKDTKKNKNIFKESIDKYRPPMVECHCSQWKLSRTLDQFGYAEDFGNIGNNSMIDRRNCH